PGSELVQLLVRAITDQVRPKMAMAWPDRRINVDSQKGDAACTTERRLVEWSMRRRQVRTRPGSTYALADPSGRAAAVMWNARIPARASQGTCSGSRPPPAIITARANSSA